MVANRPGWDAVSRFRVDDLEPAYVQLHRSGELEQRAKGGLSRLKACTCCPRGCGVDRCAGETGICGVGRLAIVASAFPHHGEEECLSGERGSGTIFLSACNLRCVFCQNAEISRCRVGAEQSAAQLASTMLWLERAGCHNINFVSPSHVVPQLLEAVALAAAGGLRLPLVYNTNAYDTVESLRLLDGVVDIYMPDFKFWNGATARRLCKAEDYPEQARAAILEMHRQVGPLRFDVHGMAVRGVLVRHLVMPTLVAESAAVLSWLGHEVSPDTYVNVMAQYHPAHLVGLRNRRGERLYGEINRLPMSEEIEEAYVAARAAGLWRFDRRRTLYA